MFDLLPLAWQPGWPSVRPAEAAAVAAAAAPSSRRQSVTQRRNPLFAPAADERAGHGWQAAASTGRWRWLRIFAKLKRVQVSSDNVQTVTIPKKRVSMNAL